MNAAGITPLSAGDVGHTRLLVTSNEAAFGVSQKESNTLLSRCFLADYLRA